MKIAIHVAGKAEPELRDATPEEEAALAAQWQAEQEREAAKQQAAEPS